MKRIYWVTLSCIVMLAISSITVQAADPFYKGKNIRIIVGYSPGGGFDRYARMIARHMGKYIPGKPNIIVQNMPGAGSLISANYISNIAKPDGLTIANFSGGWIFGQVLERPGIEFDIRKLEYLGVPNRDSVVYVFTKKSGITSYEKLKNSPRPVKMGGLEPGSLTPDNCTRIVRDALDLPIKIISGYKGTAEMRLACESGELDGTVRVIDSLMSDWFDAWKQGEIIVVLQATSKPTPEFPTVPLAIDLAKTEEAKKLISLGIHNPSEYSRTYVLPPGTPKDRVKLLREAFNKTFEDKEFGAEAEKARMGINYVTGEELEKMVMELAKQDKNWLAKMKKILYD